MKTQLTSVDIYILARELNKALNSARIDKVYQIGKKELKLRVYTREHESRELVIALGYVCITRYERAVPKEPSSFAMQLRKHLRGGFIREVKQHEFDRILEFEIEKRGGKSILMVELFSKGNVILCNKDRKILGLLEWQRWKDRKLGVGQRYEYPPEVVNPLEIDFDRFKRILKQECKKKLAAVLAVDLNLGGFYAEELCLMAGLDREKNYLNENEIRILFDSFKELMETVSGEKTNPMLIIDKEQNTVDVVPFDFKSYKEFEKKEFDSFNKAVDEYFSSEELEKGRRKLETVFQNELKKYRVIEKQQMEIIQRLEEDAKNYRKIGDLIYQNFQAVDKILRSVKEEKFIEGRIHGIKVEDIDKEGFITLDVEG